MDISAVLLAIIVFLAATAACVILFQRLGFGSILGFIVAGVLIGPHTPGPVPVHAVDELQSIAELGVVLFMFSVGLEMRPEKVWQMRRLIFGLVLFLAVLFAAWAVEQVGISMTLGAFLLGMLLSASDLRYQIEATVAPFKQTLMGLFFIAVGMSIDVGALLVDWDMLLIQVPILLMLKLAVLGGLALAFGIGRSAAIRTGFYLSQVGEFAVERDIAVVQVAKRAGREVYFGDLYSPSTQEAAGLGKAAAVFVTSHDSEAAKALALTLHRLYPQLDVYVRVRTIADQDALVAKGIKHAGTGYIESTLARGGMLLQDLGVSEADVGELLSTLRRDDYALIRAAYAEGERA